jgi:hypothetical protein
MSKKSNARPQLLKSIIVIAALGFAAQALASPPVKLPPDVDVSYTPEQSCGDFGIDVGLTGSNYHLKEYLDRSGNVVRLILAGKGSLMTITKADTDAPTLTFKAYGFSAKIEPGADGLTTQTISGHVLLTMFDTDFPAGPSTTMLVGRLVLQIDGDNVSTLVSFSGKSTDVCAALF